MFKKIFKITKSGTQEIEGVRTWIVSWISRYGSYSSETKKCYQAFTDYESALKFKKSLEDAFKLIGSTCENKVTIKEQNVGL